MYVELTKKIEKEPTLKKQPMSKQIIPGLVSCYTNGDDSFYYFKNGQEIRELSSCDNVVRILSVDDYKDLVYFYHNNDWSAYDPFFLKVEPPNESAERIKESQEIVDKDYESRYLYDIPEHLLK
jgi:hypothetical protein